MVFDIIDFCVWCNSKKKLQNKNELLLNEDFKCIEDCVVIIL